jgi:hypothetical protein
MTGVQSCGSIWACPVCAAKIRERRADDISRGALAHMAVGGSIYMATLNARHRIGRRLAPLLPTVIGGFRQKLISGRRGSPNVRPSGSSARSAPPGSPTADGWHPHLHVLVFCQGTPDPADLARAIDRWGRAWREWTAQHGFDASPARGVPREPVVNAGQAAEYVAKLQDGKDVGRELFRGDLTAGRAGSLLPFELLEHVRATGDVDALDVWHEFEHATFGRRAIEWSRGLRARLLPTTGS